LVPKISDLRIILNDGHVGLGFRLLEVDLFVRTCWLEFLSLIVIVNWLSHHTLPSFLVKFDDRKFSNVVNPPAWRCTALIFGFYGPPSFKCRQNRCSYLFLIFGKYLLGFSIVLKDECQLLIRSVSTIHPVCLTSTCLSFLREVVKLMIIFVIHF
jgi:hypothetical protein